MGTTLRKTKIFSKQITGSFVIVLGVFIFLELTLRLGAFLWSGFNQYYLYYGIHELFGRVGIHTALVYTGDYYKFPPNYQLKGMLGQSAETASIDSLGFRGPDFQAKKPENVFRIVCLGGSSTFGFHDSDEGTYPFQLQQLFNHDRSNTRIEVINAGFPYYNTGSILSLLENELLEYSPDLLTLYSAGNDSGWPLEVGILMKTDLWLFEHSMIYFLTKRSVQKIQDTRIFKRVMPKIVNYDTFNEILNQMSRRYRANVKAIIAIGKRRGIPIILIKQPMTSDRRRYISVSYEEEHNLLADKFRKKQPLRVKEAMLIRHHRLMMELENIAKEENLPVVDNITIVDQDRSRLTSWIHLTEEGNLRLAEAIKVFVEGYLAQSGMHQRSL